VQRIKIQAESLARSRTVRDAIRAALRSETAASLIDRAVVKTGFRRYSPTTAVLSPEIAAVAANAFFTSGSKRAAEDEVTGRLDHAAVMADLLEDLRHSRTLAALSDAITEAVLDRFPAASPREIAARASSALADDIQESLSSSDRSTPLDALAGSEVIACYVPGLDECGLAGTMTSFWTDESSALTAKPDTAFMRFLELVNVDVPEWIEAVHKYTGQRLDEDGPDDWHGERARAWRSASCGHDPSRGPLAKLPRLVQAVDACYLGFTPMIAFNADAAHVCSRDWNRPLSLKGGVVGLHDFLNGSGDPVRFEQKVTVVAKPGDMMVGEGRSCDFEEVHGFVRTSFRSKVSDGPHPSMEETSPFRPG